MTIVHGTDEKKSSINGDSMGFFTGQVCINPYLAAEGMSIADVQPCARTKWHRHEGGQFLRVLAGTGWVCDKGRKPQRLNVGDLVWCPPGTTHWHGADDGTYMVHQAVSNGKVDWYDAVSNDEYASKQ